jgi:acyl dehydratase
VTPRRTFRSEEDLRQAIGRQLGPTGWISVDQDLVTRFADVTGDHQWIHVDVEKASGSPFGGTIAHGFLVLSLIPRLASELIHMDLGSARLNYGLDRVRFPASTPSDTRLRGSAVLGRVTPTPRGLRVVFEWTIHSEGQSRPVCVAESITLVLA